MSVILKLFLAVALVGFSPRFQQQITYISQPEEVAIFLNNMAYVRDSLSVAGDSAVQIQLPPQTFMDTLIVRANGERVPDYRMQQGATGVFLQLPASKSAQDISLEYLLTGLSWKPTYDLEITSIADVSLDFFVEIQNTALVLAQTEVILVAGEVDVTQQLDPVSQVSMNQVIVGYDEVDVASLNTGAVTIQHLYPVGQLSAEVGEVIYTQIVSAELGARRLLVWNAATDNEVTVIYKVANTTTLPFAQGVVRSYQNGLFVGSDFMETTPIGSEGSVTVGGLQNIRVRRTQSQTTVQDALLGGEFDYRYDITLTMENFSEDDIRLEVVDTWVYNAQEFEFSREPAFEGDNLLRWVVDIAAGESLTLSYSFLTD